MGVSMKRALILLALAGAALASAQDPHLNETTKERDARMKWWREARFGMFIHWGLYAEPAGTWEGKRYPGIGEWLMHDAKIPVDTYAALAPKFNPVKFDADKWVAIAKAAGMKYIVMTAKHHDGFAMFHSADPYNIFDATPFKRDPIAEMSAACRKAGIRFGVYYSQAQDWHHAGGGAYGGHWDPKQDGDMSKYVQTVAAPQIAELMKLKPAVLWFDTPVPMSKEDINALTRPLPKSLIFNNRLGNGVPGDTETPEQTIPATGFPGQDWETCMTINDTWGFKSYDFNFKSAESLTRNLIDIASKGGNYLLNVGPDVTGIIPEGEVDRLAQMGAWLKKNGRSIYATSASPYKRLPFRGRATVKGNSLFVNVFEWPQQGLNLPGLQTPVKEVQVVATGQKLTFTQSKDGMVTIAAPTATDSISTAIELKLAAKPVVMVPETVLDFDAKGRVLPIEEATLTGGLQVEHTPPNIGYWTDASGSVSWKVTATEDFRGEVHLDYACDAGAGGSVVGIMMDGVDTGVWAKIPETGAWDSYKTIFLHESLRVPKGTHVIKLFVKSMPAGAVMNLRSFKIAAGHY
jgi:alpha-L-fucosidase